ncbi:MAG: ORF6N domain-containing protein [Elusimicrobia bacterium]|nr:ORF6N domain-containing protein [Elusimicrobiota bacterium]
MPDNQLIPVERLQSRIVVLRSQRVLLDADLARLYGVPTKRLNEQVKRNGRKFPEDFVFRLTRDEAEAVRRSRSHIATLKRGQNVKEAIRLLTATPARSHGRKIGFRPG